MSPSIININEVNRSDKLKEQEQYENLKKFKSYKSFRNDNKYIIQKKPNIDTFVLSDEKF